MQRGMASPMPTINIFRLILANGANVTAGVFFKWFFVVKWESTSPLLSTKFRYVSQSVVWILCISVLRFLAL